MVITELDVAKICKLVVTLKRLDLFYEYQDKEFWNQVEHKLSRFPNKCSDL